MLVFRLTLRFDFGLPDEFERQAWRDIRPVARRELRQALNKLRSRARGDAPVKSGRLRSSLRIRNAQTRSRQAVAMELFTPLHYAAFSNARGRSAGWWDASLIESGFGSGTAAAREVLDPSAVRGIVEEMQRALIEYTRSVIGQSLLGATDFQRRGSDGATIGHTRISL